MDVLWLAIHLSSATPSLASERERLAYWAGAFTPRVSVADSGLLLEIGGCLRLFGSLEALHEMVVQGLADQDIVANIAVAATPQSALWLAEGGGDVLDALPVSAITWPTGVQEKLIRFGLRRLGELRRLPPAALSRRIGRQAMSLIARAYGEAPDPRLDFVFPQRFKQAIELPVPVENAPALLFAARRLTAALAGWLTAQQAGLRECRFDLVHRQGTTELVLRFADITRDGGRFERVLRERLERLQLTAPVEALRLAAETVEALPGRSGGLFDEGATKESMTALIERLRARLGEDRIFGLVPVADHRPECATHRAFPGAQTELTWKARPFWLLAVPEALAEVAGRPHRRGPVKLLVGPERIESGWWNQEEGVGDLRRDYFIALTPDARWAWIFRELRPPGGWFLHGWFA